VQAKANAEIVEHLQPIYYFMVEAEAQVQGVVVRKAIAIVDAKFPTN
jgi:hypothetical protein